MIPKFALYATKLLAINCIYVSDQLTEEELYQFRIFCFSMFFVAASVKRAIANSYAKMPRGSKFQYVAHNSIEDSCTDLLPSGGGEKRNRKNTISLRNYPARTVIMRIVKRMPSFLCFRLSRRLQLPSTNSSRRILWLVFCFLEIAPIEKLNHMV